jgi:fibronectin-binding autotransporter adhesin
MRATPNSNVNARFLLSPSGRSWRLLTSTALVSCLGGLLASVSASAQSVATSGDVNPSPATSPVWNVGGVLDVGRFGPGMLAVEGGGAVISTYGQIGLYAGAIGTVSVTGAGSSWTSNSSIYVGHFGSGTLTIGNGGVVDIDTSSIIGNQAGSIGTATVTGVGSTWTSGNYLTVGHSGSGTLTVAQGGTVTNTESMIGFNSGSTGKVTVTGAGSSWTNSGYVAVGQDGSGALNIEAGGAVSTTSGYIAGGAGSTAAATVTGAGSTWTNSRDFAVGVSGNGTLTVAASGAVSNFDGYIGYQANSTGTATVTGAGSTWTSSGQLIVGYHGSGNLTVSNGGAVGSVAGWIGDSSGSIGTAMVTGKDSTWSMSNNLAVGLNGRGSLTISDGATVSSATGYIGFGTHSIGAVTLTGAGSTWTNSGNLYVGLSGVGALNIGAAAGASAAAAGVLDAATVTLGTGTLVFNHTDSNYGFAPQIVGAGAVEVHSGTTVLTGDSSGFSGRTTVSGGTLLVGDAAGNGALGGAVTIAAGGTLGGSGTLTGAVSIDGTLSAGNSPGTLTFDSNLTLGAGATSVFELNMPGVVAGTGAGGNDLVVVNGTLTLGGTLDARVAAAGFYRLFDYSTLAPGSAFASESVTSARGGFTVASHELQYTRPGQVNLSVLGAGQTMQFWDGASTTSNGTVDGGHGVWRGFGTNWTNVSGTSNAGWAGSVGVFAGTAGTVTVDGTQRFDTLQFSADGYVLRGGALELAPAAGDAGTLNVDTGLSATIDSVIADGSAAALAKVGGGTLVLTGTNTYTGGTALAGGVVSVASDTNLGAATGALTFDGGVLRVTGTDYAVTNRTILLGPGGGGFDIGDAANRFTLAGDISGPGDLHKQGGGTLMLTGSNAYGNTLVRAGTLVGHAGSLSGAIGNAGTVVFDQAGNASFGGDIAGLGGFDGAMIKRGAGSLTLAGTSSLDWAIEAGGVVSATDRFRGDAAIDAGASLTFDQAVDGSYAGSISGRGEFAKSGAGTARLNGDSFGFSGTTMVSGGELLVGDVSGGRLGGAITVLSGATLSGPGTIGSAGSPVTINAGGNHMPGDGTASSQQVVAGDYVNHGTLTIVGGPSGASRVVVAGSVDITDARLDLLLSPNNVAGWSITNGPFTIIEQRGTGAVTGTFGKVTDLNRLLFLDHVLDYAGGDGNDVTLTFRRNNLDFAGIARTRNQQAAGAAVGGLPQTNPVWNAVALLSEADEARASFDLLSGEAHAQGVAVAIGESRLMREAVLGRLRGPLLPLPGTPVAGAFTDLRGRQGVVDMPTPRLDERFIIWGEAVGAQASTNADGNAAGLSRRTGGAVLGADLKLHDSVASSLSIGVAGGYTRSTFDIDGRLSSGRLESGHALLYAGARLGAWRLDGGLGYSFGETSLTRQVRVSSFGDTLRSQRGSELLQGFAELGYAFRLERFAFEPFAQLALLRVSSGSDLEQGGAVALRVFSGEQSLGFATLGLRAEAQLGAMPLFARGLLGWRYGFGELAPRAMAAFAAGSIPARVHAAEIDRNALIAEAGLDWRANASTSLGLAYSAAIGERTRDHALKGRFEVRF